MTSSIESDPTIMRLPSPAAMDGITDLSFIHSSINSTSTTHDNNDTSNKRMLLASSSWDGCIRIHDTTDISNGADKAKLVALNNMESGPLLSIDAYTTTSGTSDTTDNSEEAFIITGGLDGSIKRFVVSSSQIQSIGSHYLLNKSTTSTTNNNNDGANGDGDNHLDASACSCVKALSCNHVASAGWDSMFCIWKCHNDSTDTDTDNTDKDKAPLVQLKLPDKAFSMDAIPIHNNSNNSYSDSNNAESYRIAISTAGKRLLIIDIQNLHTPNPTATIILNRESSLKYQSRTCRFFPSGNGLAIGSIEGRVAIEFLNDAPLNIPSPSGMKKYAFKCHRSGDIVYPVNAIAFHPKFETFATGGCDGTVVTWDGLHKKKLTVLPEFETSIAALAFNHDGSQLAIASSYTFEEGVRDGDGDGDGNGSGNGNGDENGKKVKDDIYIKLIDEKDVMPKSFK
jgi:cell cycle arrest protein BUB3